MPKPSFTFTHFLTSDPSPFPSLLLLLLICAFHVPAFRFQPSPYCNNCAGHKKMLCNPIALSSTPQRLPYYGGFGWALRAAPVALLVVVSWLPQNDSAGVAAGKWGWSPGFRVPTISEAGEIGGCTPWVLVGMILLLFYMAQRQALIRHCLFVTSL